MSTQYARTRSNRFEVKDLKAFLQWCEKLNLELLDDAPTSSDSEKESAPISLGFLCSGPIPDSYYDEEISDYVEIEFIPELAAHLKDGQVAIIMEVGWEKFRYLSGIAIAVNSEGEWREVNLFDIHTLAEDLGQQITACEY